MIPPSEWVWHGHAAHFILGARCRYHLATTIGSVVVSTVGECYLHRDDEKPHPIGFDRLYETMVFRVGGVCAIPECACGAPQHDGNDIDFAPANTAREARENHMRLCAEWAQREGEQ